MVGLVYKALLDDLRSYGHYCEEWRTGGIMLEVGNEAPKFSALDQDGNELSLADFSGSWVLFWWYPKASTPG